MINKIISVLREEKQNISVKILKCFLMTYSNINNNLNIHEF